MCIKIIIGIGNIDKKLLNTRHNVGIWFIKKILNIKNIKFNKIYKKKIKKKNILFYIPKTYINLCGKNIYNIKKKKKIKNKEILIVHDEINLKPGETKIKYNIGKKNTHNGIKNIIKYLKKSNFYQLRIGIGRPKKKNKLKKFVLSSPNKKQKKLIYKSIKISIYYISKWIKNKNINQIQNFLNKRNINLNKKY